MCLGSGNDLRTPQVWRVSTLAWRVKSVGSDHKYWPPLETAVSQKEVYSMISFAGWHSCWVASVLGTWMASLQLFCGCYVTI